MATAKAVALDPVADLRRRLRVRGRRPLATLVQRWWGEHGLAEHPAAVGKRVAVALLEQHSATELRSAGILVLSDLLADHVRIADLEAFGRLFETGGLSDGAIVDTFAIKVLGTLLGRVRGRADAARALARWQHAESPWQRRAACVAFTTLAPQGDSACTGFGKLVFTMCSTVLWSRDRADQTAAAWLLRELSRAEPTRVEAFIRRHARFMSREAIERAIERLPEARQGELVAHWKRATTLQP